MMKEQLSLNKKGWEFLHVCYALIGNSEGLCIGKSWSRQKKNRIRTSLFFFLFIYMWMIYVQNVYQTNAFFRYHWLVFGGVIFLLALVSKEKKLVVSTWDTKVSRYWLIFWLFVCISDFIVPKKMRLVGWMMLFVVGFFIFVWQHMEHPKDIIHNFFGAVELLAVVGMIYNILFRAKYDGLLYHGYLRSASEFGAFSAFLCLIFLIQIYDCWKKNDYGKKMAVPVCGTVCSAFQVLLSGKKVVVIYAAVLVVVACVGILKGFWHLSKLEKRKLLGYGILACGIVCVYYFGVKNLSSNLHTEVLYVKEKFESNKDPAVIEILANSGKEVYQKVQYENREEQKMLWLSYLKETNLFGHSKWNLKVGKKAQPPQNLFLQILFRYGMIAFVFYLLLFGCATLKVMCKLSRNWKKPDSVELLTGGVLLFWWTVGFFCDLEYPYLQPVWLLVYLLLGRTMTEKF